MAQLARDEQVKVDIAEAMDAAFRRGERTVLSPTGQTVFVTEKTVENAQQIAENMRRNAGVRERMKAERVAEEAAKAAERQAKRDAAATAERDAFWRSKQISWPGTAAEFERLKQRLWEDELLRRAQDVDVVAQKRASGVYDQF